MARSSDPELRCATTRIGGSPRCIILEGVASAFVFFVGARIYFVICGFSWGDGAYAVDTTVLTRWIAWRVELRNRCMAAARREKVSEPVLLAGRRSERLHPGCGSEAGIGNLPFDGRIIAAYCAPSRSRSGSIAAKLGSSIASW